VCLVGIRLVSQKKRGVPSGAQLQSTMLVHPTGRLSHESLGIEHFQNRLFWRSTNWTVGHRRSTSHTTSPMAAWSECAVLLCRHAHHTLIRNGAIRVRKGLRFWFDVCLMRVLAMRRSAVSRDKVFTRYIQVFMRIAAAHVIAGALLQEVSTHLVRRAFFRTGACFFRTGADLWLRMSIPTVRDGTYAVL